jgi:hypothetical protein
VRCEELYDLAYEYGMLCIEPDGVGYRMVGEEVQKLHVHRIYGCTIRSKWPHSIVAIRPMAEYLGMSAEARGLDTIVREGSKPRCLITFGSRAPSSPEELLSLM